MVLARPVISHRRTAQSPLREIPSSSIESLTAASSASSSSGNQKRILETPITSPLAAKFPGSDSDEENYDHLMKSLLEVKYSPREEGLDGFDLTEVPALTVDERLAAVITRSPTPVEAAQAPPKKQDNDLYSNRAIGKIGSADDAGSAQNMNPQATRQPNDLLAVPECKRGKLRKPTAVKKQWPLRQLSNSTKLNSVQVPTCSKATPRVSSQRQATLLGHVTRSKPPQSPTTSRAVGTVGEASPKSNTTAAAIRQIDAEILTAKAPRLNVGTISDAQCQTSSFQETCHCGKPLDVSPCGVQDLTVHILLKTDVDSTRDVGTGMSIGWQRACYCAVCLNVRGRSVAIRKRKLPAVDEGLESPVTKRLATSKDSVQQDSERGSSSSHFSHGNEPEALSTAERATSTDNAPAKPEPFPKEQLYLPKRPTLFENVCKICSDLFPFTATGSSFFCPPCANQQSGTIERGLPKRKRQIAVVAQELGPTHLSCPPSDAEAIPARGSWLESDSSSCKERARDRKNCAAATLGGHSIEPDVHVQMSDGGKGSRVPLQQEKGVQTVGSSTVQCPERDCTNRICQKLYPQHGMSVARAVQQSGDRKTRHVATQASWSGSAICLSCKASKLLAKKRRRRQTIIAELRRQEQQRKAIEQAKPSIVESGSEEEEPERCSSESGSTSDSSDEFSSQASKLDTLQLFKPKECSSQHSSTSPSSLSSCASSSVSESPSLIQKPPAVDMDWEGIAAMAKEIVEQDYPMTQEQKERAKYLQFIDGVRWPGR